MTGPRPLETWNLEPETRDLSGSLAERAYQQLKRSIITGELAPGAEILEGALAARLRETSQAVAADSFLSVRSRLARALLELAKVLGEEEAQGRIAIRHKISQNDLAAMAGIARENVSRVLSEWRRRNVVTRSGGHYCLRDIARLKRRAES